MTIEPAASIAQTVELMRKSGISQLPVLEGGRPIGSIQEITIARVLHDDVDLSKVRVADVMAKPLPQIDVAVHLDEVYRLLLAGNSGVLATQTDHVIGIVTRIDLIEYWNSRRNG